MAYRDAEIPVQICHGCGQRETEGTEVCSRCGRPMDVAQFAELELKLVPALRSARRNLVVVIALNLVLVAALAVARRPFADVVTQLALVALYVGCLALGHSRPYAGALLALCLFALCEIAATVAVPLRLFPGLGLMIRLALLYSLVQGVRSGFRARDLRRQAGRHDRKILVGALALTVVLGAVAGIGARLVAAEASNGDDLSDGDD